MCEPKLEVYLARTSGAPGALAWYAQALLVVNWVSEEEYRVVYREPHVDCCLAQAHWARSRPAQK